jgi:AcrR family transcriptional regulator
MGTGAKIPRRMRAVLCAVSGRRSKVHAMSPTDEATPAAAIAASTTAADIRARNRADLIAEIVRIGRAHLIRDGVAGLSLRAVTRELGMASSAVYRYVASRDELLTLLIADAHADLAITVEKACFGADPGDLRARWTAFCLSLRRWAIRHPAQYALLYGPPVVGYSAPVAADRADARLVALFAAILRDSSTRKVTAVRSDPAVGPALSADMTALLASPAFAAAKGSLKRRYLARGLLAWTQVFGLVSAESFGRTAPGVTDTDAFFAYAVDMMADLLDLPPAPVEKSPKAASTKPATRNAWAVRPKRNGP